MRWQVWQVSQQVRRRKNTTINSNLRDIRNENYNFSSAKSILQI